MKITKTKEEIEKLKKGIKKELDELPDVNFFGGSNEESKKESQEWIDELDRALNNIFEEGDEDGSEIYWWLTGRNDSFGKLYMEE